MKPFSKIAALVFLIVAAVHVYRLVRGAQIMLGSHSIPMWASVAGAIVALIFSYGLWKESKAS